MSRLVDLTPPENARLVCSSDVAIEGLPGETNTLATVVDLTPETDLSVIDRKALAQICLAGVAGCILHTSWIDDRLKGEDWPAPAFGVDAAGYLLESGVRTVAADFPIVGASAEMLLANGCLLVYPLINIDELCKPIVRLDVTLLDIEGCGASVRVTAIEE